MDRLPQLFPFIHFQIPREITSCVRAIGNVNVQTLNEILSTAVYEVIEVGAIHVSLYLSVLFLHCKMSGNY